MTAETTQAATAQQIADLIADAHKSGEPIAPVRDRIPDVDAAYAAQEVNTDRWLAAGRRLVGRKIGLTSRPVQEQFGVYQPDFGMLFADTAVCDGEEIEPGRLVQPRVEAEVAFILGRDLAADQPTVADVLRATEFVLPAIEIVDSRIAGWDIKICDTVADNASSGLFVLGTRPTRLRDVDLRSAGMVMESGGEPVSTGAGAACLGDPVTAVTWLARTMAERGRPLLAGDIVLSGALGPMVAALPGNVYEARVEGLGSVRAAFGRNAS